MRQQPSTARKTVACMLFASVVLASDEDPIPWVHVESLSTPTVHVVSTDAIDYDAIAGNTYAYSLQIYGDCATNNRDVVLVQGKTPTNPSDDLPTIDTSDLVHPTRWLPSHFATQPDTNLPITWPLEMRHLVVKACNDNLAAKMLGDAHGGVGRAPAHHGALVAGGDDGDRLGHALRTDRVFEEFAHLAAAFADQRDDDGVECVGSGQHGERCRFANA